MQIKLLDGGKAATYTYELKANFTDGDKITIGGQTFTATATAPGANEFQIGTGGANAAANLKTTRDNLIAALNANATVNIGYIVTPGSPSAPTDPNSITITAKTAGVDANAAAFSTGVFTYKTLGQY